MPSHTLTASRMVRFGTSIPTMNIVLTAPVENTNRKATVGTVNTLGRRAGSMKAQRPAATFSMCIPPTGLSTGSAAIILMERSVTTQCMFQAMVPNWALVPPRAIQEGSLNPSMNTKATLPAAIFT